MTGEDFCKVCCLDLRQYIVDICKALTNDKNQQADLYYAAWMTIASIGGDKVDEYYMSVAYNVMMKRYVLHYMPKPKEGRYPADDPGIRRGKRKKLRFYKKNNWRGEKRQKI